MSMLHLEVYADRPANLAGYLGGNWSGDGMPEHLLDPGDYLQSAGGTWSPSGARKETPREPGE